MLSKWIITIDRFKLFRFGEDGKLYKLPFKSNGKHYGLREIKLNPTRNSWRLNGEEWTKTKLKPHIDVDPNPILLFQTDKMPF